MNTWDTVADDATLEKTAKALEANGIAVKIVASASDAKKEVLALIPEGAEVMNMTSVTLDEASIAKEILESGRYNAVRNTLNSMNRETQNLEMQKLGAGPDWAIGSVHAVTENGEVVIASNTGSQLSAYANGASHIIWVVGGQKIVLNMDEAMKRVYEHSLPLESERAKKAYGVERSNVSKVLVVNKEVNDERITMILIKEKIGF